ncbi:uncharacterized protein LOC143862217 [Tasmannia lanceolata]|uniref:uncharacterized protein LOC143862217 n=1 Tax=Tasmannia lanceolata TaxID=3420 RepID=UPI00406425F5
MGNQVEDFYLNLSRKELQGLCKKHGLPANRSKSHLVNLLVSFFKGKNASPATSGEERPSDFVEGSPLASCMSDLKPKATMNSSGETIKDIVVHKRNVEASDVDSYGPSRRSKEKVGYDKVQSRTGNRVETSSQMEAETSDKVSDGSADVVCNPANNGTTEGFGCSTSDPRTVDMQHVAPTHPRDITARLQVGCDENGVNYRKYNPLNCNSNSEIDNLQQIHSRNIKVGSSNDNRMEVPPSFQFFVRSDEGINLCVDLSSSPSNWVKSLKDEVCMQQRMNPSKSRVLHQELRLLGDNVEHMKILVKYPETSLQTKESECNIDSRAIKSPVRSTVIQDCNSGAYHLESANEPLRSSAITSNGFPVENLRHLEEDKRVMPSACIPNSDIQNKNTSNLDVNMISDGPYFPNSLECQLSKIASNPEKSEAHIVSFSNVVSGVSEKVNPPLCGEIHEDFSSSNIISHEKHSGYSASGSLEMQLARVTFDYEGTSAPPCHFGDQQGLDCPKNNLQLEKGGLADHQLEKEACCKLGSPVVDPTSVLPEEEGRSALINEKESSECSQFDNLLDMTSKRTHSSEFQEESPSRRLRNKSENPHNAHAKSILMNLRSSKNLGQEQLLPRRSKRLVSKLCYHNTIVKVKMKQYQSQTKVSASK